MFSYFVYGLGIHSELLIPEFISALVECDVTIHINQDKTVDDYLPEEATKEAWAIRVTPDKGLVYVKNVGIFLVDSGQKITIVPAPEASEQVIRHYLVGTVMSLLLYQRGLLVLHASVVNFNGGAIAFLGQSGEGKSSTAAAFYARGYNICNDDVAPVQLGQGAAKIDLGFPQIKLGRETATALGYDFESLLLLHPDEEKRAYCFQQELAQAPLPIRGIYVLTSGLEFRIEPLKPSEAVMELSRHSRPTTLYHSGGASHFLQCVALAKEHTIYRLQRPRNLNLLPELVKLVEEHVHCNLQLTPSEVLS